jgi:hypothetical protein
VFVEAGKPSKAMVAHEKALEWRELFTLAPQCNITDEDTVSTGYRVAGQYDIRFKIASSHPSTDRGTRIEKAAFGGSTSSAGLLQGLA